MWCWDTRMCKWMLRRSLLLSKLTTVQAVLLLPWRRKPTDQILRKTTIKKQKFSIARPPPQTEYWRFPESMWELLWSASHLQISSFSNACRAIYLTCHVMCAFSVHSSKSSDIFDLLLHFSWFHSFFLGWQCSLHLRVLKSTFPISAQHQGLFFSSLSTPTLSLAHL